MARSLSVLVITESPDDRESTRSLRDIVDNLATRTSVRTSMWFLRDPESQAWEGTRVVDDLRTWEPAVRLDRCGMPRLGAVLRGARLRLWLTRARPDVVILDDGLGSRVVEHVRRPLTVVRLNPSPSSHAGMEPPPLEAAGLWLAHHTRAGDVPRGAPLVLADEVREYASAGPASAPQRRRAAREQLGLPLDAPLVAGWGDDGWLDGPDVFVRGLWALEARHGVAAHGVWFSDAGDRHDVARLRAEANRCGVGGRFHPRRQPHPDLRLCADAVFLPHRATGDRYQVLRAVAGGLEVVTFPALEVDDPAVQVVGHLDVDAAAAALSSALSSDRTRLIAEARERIIRERIDVRPFVDHLVGVLEDRLP